MLKAPPTDLGKGRDRWIKDLQTGTGRRNSSAQPTSLKIKPALLFTPRKFVVISLSHQIHGELAWH